MILTKVDLSQAWLLLTGQVEEMMMKYQDGLQGKIEGQLLSYGKGKKTKDQLVGATMFQFNMFYDEAEARITQALRAIKLAWLLLEQDRYGGDDDGKTKDML